MSEYGVFMAFKTSLSYVLSYWVESIHELLALTCPKKTGLCSWNCRSFCLPDSVAYCKAGALEM
jgi:hypothetical protein